jgi:magnesium-transporting ATPase (P-type)
MDGLTTTEAARRLATHGPNLLPEKSGESLLKIFARQFNSPFVYVLFIAAMMSFGLGQNLNGLFIFLVLLLNASIGATQEYSAQRAAVALKKIVPQHAVVIRDGVATQIDAVALVPDDVVLLVSGDKIPADLQLLECRDLLVDESSLTGESLANAKQAEEPIPADAPISARTDTVFAGTIVTHGRARGCVTETGADTQIGRIASEVSVTGTAKPPLLQRIERFTLRVSYAVIAVIAFLFLVTALRGENFASVFLLGVALAVSAIPEGLPAAITVALAIGMRRMAKKNVIVRKLIAVEALGSCTYIASDKTGTLTVNDLTVKKIILPDGSSYNVSGEGLDIHGVIDDDSRNNNMPDAVQDLVRCGLLANEASFTFVGGAWKAHGDGVDIAFLVLAAKAGFDLERTRSTDPVQSQVPYESEQAYSASTNTVSGKPRHHVKGSAERILPMCIKTADGGDLDPAMLRSIEQQVAELAGHGYRVLALAEGEADQKAGDEAAKQFEGLSFLGIVGMIDPLRPEVPAAVKSCRQANIEVAMITGDHALTALALAREAGIVDTEARVTTGEQIQAAAGRGGTALTELITGCRVFARVEPTQKLTIVQELINQGHFVAVTGDGVNDAPALHHAHVGIAMGKRGTDIARETSDLILTDDNFSSIVEGIKQGRIVYSNIRKVVFLLISTGAAEITLFILSVLFGLPIPLFPIQLLWLNLVTNGIQDIALAFEPAEGDELKRRPREPTEPIFNKLMIQRVLVNAVVMGGIAFSVFSWQLGQGVDEYSARNITLLLMVLFENVHVLNSRSEKLSIFRQKFFGNPFLIFGMLAAQAIHIAAMYTPGLKAVLQVEPVTFTQWITLFMLALLLIIVDESHKLFDRFVGFRTKTKSTPQVR